MFAIEIILLVYFAYISCYAFILSVAAVFYKGPRSQESKSAPKIAVLIPSYKEDNVIVSVAAEALKQNYPHNRLDVVVIADPLQPLTISALKRLPLSIVEVSFHTSTKVKSLNKAMAAIGD